MLRVFQSGSASERLIRAREFTASRCAAGAFVISATRGAADDFVRAIGVETTATFGLHRFSLLQFAFQLARAELARRGLAPVTSAGTDTLAIRAAFEVRSRGGLQYFQIVADKPGFSLALANSLRDLRAARVDPPRLSSLGSRGRDLAILLSEYESQLKRAGLLDANDIYRLAAQQVENGAEMALVAPVLLLDVQITSVAEQEFVSALTHKISDVFATVVAGDARTASAFSALSGTLESDAARTQTSLDRLQNFLFEPTSHESYSDDGLTQFFSAPGEGRECVEIARRIQQASRLGTKFDQIAVAVRAPQAYAPVLEAALVRAGVPAYFSLGTRRPDPSGRALLALLLCAEEGLSAKRFAEYLSLGQVPSSEQASVTNSPGAAWVGPPKELLSDTADQAELPDAPPPEHTDEDAPMVAGSLRAPWKWEELLVEGAVVGGLSRWGRRLNGLNAELTAKIKAERLDQPDSPLIAKLERQQSNLAHLQRFALPVLRTLAALPERAMWREWLEHLRDLAISALRRPQHVLTALSDLQGLGDIGPVSLPEVREALSTRLSQLHVEPPRSRYGRVVVGTPEQLRGRWFATVFVPGLAERIFPQKVREDPLLPDSDRLQLVSSNPLLHLSADRAREERLRLRLCAGAAKQSVVFSYPRLEVALARPRVPSFYALDVFRTNLGALPNLD